TVAAEATLDFTRTVAGSGQSVVTDIEAGDSDNHTLTINGGTVQTTVNSIVVQVAMLVDQEDGEFTLDGDDTGLLHFTSTNEMMGEPTYVVDSGFTTLKGDMKLEGGA